MRAQTDGDLWIPTFWMHALALAVVILDRSRSAAQLPEMSLMTLAN